MTFLLSSLSSEIGHPAYRVHIVAADEGTVTNSLGIATAAASLDDAVLDTLVVIGGRIDPLLSAGTLSRIVEASSRCRRVASVCTGAFILAAAGLLDGRRATTHWRQAARLQREYPAIRVEADRIFCRDGNVWTSAGITAGIDLALALIEEDHGFAIAKAVAQHLVVYHRRHGGQSQFAASVDLAPKNDRIAAALGYARDHIAGELPVERLAEAAGMSLRQFSRIFRSQTGSTPARVVERLRADLARGRIETTAEPVERIAGGGRLWCRGKHEAGVHPHLRTSTAIGQASNSDLASAPRRRIERHADVVELQVVLKSVTPGRSGEEERDNGLKC
jgi:transcriptional regulator GlxA family with amidase domain